MEDKPFALIGINSDESLERAKSAVAKNKLNWRSFQNKGNGGDISKEWVVRGWPTVFILDKERKIHYRGYDFKAAAKIATKLLAQ